MVSQTKSAPGILTSVEGIPAGIVNNHNEAFFYWMKSDLKNTTLFHVDAHPDMKGAIGVEKIKSAYDYDQMNIANFICPAVNLGIISSIYWQNPHSIERRLQELGTIEMIGGRPLQSTCLKHKKGLFPKKFDYAWVLGFYLEIGKGKVITTKDIIVSQESPLILDIDIDAFCCHKTGSISYLSEDRNNYDGVSDFKRRINETISVLATLPRPDLITIATSQGEGTKCYNCYVPPAMLEEVLQYLNFNLHNLFGGSYESQRGFD